MAVKPWPPPTPPNTRANATAQLDSHPADHNLMADALDTLIMRAGGLVLVRAVGVAGTGQAGNTITVCTLVVPAAPAGATARLGLFAYAAQFGVPAADPVCTMTLFDPSPVGVFATAHYPLVNNTSRGMTVAWPVPLTAGNWTVRLSHSGTGSFTVAANAANHVGSVLLVST
jgi:hypothetical protein